ncbi:MAG TPA: SWIM zinc finger domain-containing protein, partial [Pirellulaceae bacterium]|nr:SWIM zinc finger domain-containing protein [Pirellulaceae bacterium]
ALPLVRANLKWQAAIDVEDLAARIGATASTVDAALAALGARGLVGFDIRSGTYFHRELPFQLDLIESLQPRLVNARKLVAEGRVTRSDAGAVPRSRRQAPERDGSEKAAAKRATNESENENENENKNKNENEYEYEHEYGSGNASVEYWVRSSEVEHRVVWSGESAKCTCPWFAKHGTARGPCKHILAVQLLREETEDGG